MGNGFAPPLNKLGESGIGVAAAPTGGMGLALNEKGKVPGSALQSPTMPAAACSATTALTTAFADVPGATFDFTSGAAAALALLHGAFDFQVTVAGVGVCIGQFVVDGNAVTPEAIFEVDTIAIARATVSQIVPVTLAKGDHTIKLQAKKTINAGTANIVITHTTLTALVFDYL